MGLRYYKRIGATKGWGLNLSSSGISSSYRSRYGSIGSKGFTIKTGIPGLSYRSGWGQKNSKGSGAIIFLIIIVSVLTLYASAVIAYNLLRFARWLIIEIYHLLLRLQYQLRVTKTNEQAATLNYIESKNQTQLLQSGEENNNVQ